MSNPSAPANRSARPLTVVLEVEGLTPPPEPIHPVTQNNLTLLWMLGATAGFFAAMVGLDIGLRTLPGAALALLFPILAGGPLLAGALYLRNRARRIDAHNRVILAGLPPIAEWETPEGMSCRLTAGGLTAGRVVLCVGRSGFWSLAGTISSDPWLQPSLVLTHNSNELHWVNLANDADETRPSQQRAEPVSVRVRLPHGDAGESVLAALRRDPRIQDDQVDWRSPGGEIVLHRNGSVVCRGLETLPAGTTIAFEGPLDHRTLVLTPPPVAVPWRGTPPEPGEETRPADPIRIALPAGEPGERIVRALVEPGPMQSLKAAVRPGANTH